VPAAGGPLPEPLERVLSATPAQFERDLRAAWPAAQGSAEEGWLGVEHDGVRLEIAFEAAGLRRLGALALPQLRVRYRFSGGDEAAGRALLQRLDRAMQKGGG
jgi:hypothetical protein